jgi:hypothetical protein
MLVSMIEAIRESRRVQTAKGPELVELLKKTQISFATDTRDLVFALLGIVSNKLLTRVIINYLLKCSKVY